MFVLTTLALAHVPHQQVIALAPTPELDDSAPWFALVQPYAASLMRSDDAGRTWYHHGGDPLGDGPVGLARTSDGVVAVLGTTRYWWSSDDGVSWASDWLPGEVAQIGSAGPALLLAGEGGIWAVAPGELPELESDTPTWRLGRGVNPTAIDDTGTVWIRVGHDWVALPSPGEGVTATAAAGAMVFAGTPSGNAWRWDGVEWAACGALPVDEAHPNLVALATDGRTLLAGSGVTAPYSSDLACQDWRDRGPPERTVYSADGGAESALESVTALATASGRVTWAGWTGLWTLTHGTWTHAPTLGADFTRGVAIDRDSEGGLRILLGSYGAGVLRSTDGGTSWEAPSHGLGEANIQDVLPFPGDPERVLALANHSLFVSGDGARSFDVAPVDGLTQTLALEQGTPDAAWAHAESGVWSTDDQGHTWTSRPDVPTALGGGLADAVRTATATCLATSRPTTVVCAKPGSSEWSPRLAVDERVAVAMVGWPPEAPTRLLLLSGTDARRSDDDFASHGATTLLDSDSFVAATVADDGTVVAATTAGRFLVSRDGGDTWVMLDARAPAPVTALAAAPGFAESPAVLASSYDGTWLLTGLDEAAPLLAFAPRHRVDDASDFLSRAGCGIAAVDARGELDSLTTLTAGCTLRGWVRGERLVLRALGTGLATATVDGADPLPFGDGLGDEVGEALVLDLKGGWHEVEIVGVDGALMLDTVEGSWPGVTLDDPAPGDTADTAVDTSAPPDPPPADEGCSCEHGDGAAAIPLALLAVRRYRPKPRGDR